MKGTPCSEPAGEDAGLRDELAVKRTLLANERTLLAYLRSAVSLLIAGASIMHFSHPSWFWAFGVACIPAGAVAGVVGAVRYRRMNRAISLVRGESQARGSSA